MRTTCILKYLILLLFGGLTFSGCDHPSIYVAGQKCNYMSAPVGVDLPLTFSWELGSDERNKVQTAYRILVSDSEKALRQNKGNTWDPGKVNSGISTGITADDISLEPGKKYYWKVKVWDNSGNESAWSEISWFTTSLLSINDWAGAKWIALETMPDSLILVPGITTWGRNTRDIALRRPVVPMFRKDFESRKEIKSAYLFISGLGQYEAFINGKSLDDDFLKPGWTLYQETCLYNTYDVSEFLKRGMNAIGVTVGTGFYNINNERYRKLLITYGMPRVIARLLIRYKDGSGESIVTGEDWKVTHSPIIYSSIYGGESYDARMEQPGWKNPGFDDKDWQNAIQAGEAVGRLVPVTGFPVRVIETFKPVNIKKNDYGNLLVDFGQNASGIIRIKVRGQKGDTVKIFPAELINADLTASQRATGSPYYFEYILKGEGTEEWKPSFSYYGFRYAEVKGAGLQGEDPGGQPELLEIEMLHTSNSAPGTGSFWCSNPLFNNIDTLIRYAIRSNVQSVITDCPHREKLGWLEQTYLLGNTLNFNLETYHLFKKVIGDMMDSQRDDGLVPSIAPEYVIFGDAFTDSPEWGSAMIVLPWLVHKWYGDTSVIHEAWESMEKYVQYLDSKAEDFILSYGLGDWYDIGPERPGFSQLTPLEATATAIYFYDHYLLSEMAVISGRIKEAEYHEELAEKIRLAYNSKLFDWEKAVYSDGSQSSMAIPLSMGMVDEEFREQVLNNLVDSIISNDRKITAGDIGFHFLLDALNRGDRSQLIYDMNNRDDVPGYGYQIKMGATALTESWQALPDVSNNHMMLGHIEEWLYSGLGGIRQDENSVAFRNIVIAPSFPGNLEKVKTSFRSPAGLIISEWEKGKDEILMRVSIPVNTYATIILPSSDPGNITESDIPLPDCDGIEVVNIYHNRIIAGAGSGDYVFRIKKPG